MSGQWGVRGGVGGTWGGERGGLDQWPLTGHVNDGGGGSGVWWTCEGQLHMEYRNMSNSVLCPLDLWHVFPH